MEKPTIPPPPDLPTDRGALLGTLMGYSAQLRGHDAFRWFIGWVRNEMNRERRIALDESVSDHARYRATVRYNVFREVEDFVPKTEQTAKEVTARGEVVPSPH